ncbi:MAG: NADPH:quinone reductase [Acidobacteriota bacterium]|nr:NADPH:quinone reductase [Acidobacteriota bacterium]
MKAVRIHEFGGADCLRVDEVEKPQPKQGEALIKTAVAGINYADIMLRTGNYLFTPPLPFTLGFEVAGTIESVGEGVEQLRVGQRVIATLQGGGYAEYAVADAGRVVPIPENLEFGKATALLVQGLTALGLLKNLRAGQTVLIHAAAGGVGSLLVQLAKHKGARVIGTASTAQKLDIVNDLGADIGINYTESDWTERVLEATEGKGVDLLIEMVGGEIGSRNVELLAQGATMIVFGAASGEDFKISALGLLGKNLTVKGYTLYGERPETLAEFTRELMSQIEADKLRVMVQEFPLAEASRAHAAIEGRKTTGKVVLRA